MAWWEQTIGVVIGGLLTVGSNVALERWRARRGQTEALREAYVEWMACAESILQGGQSLRDTYERRLMANTRLRICERNREMAEKVWDSIPEFGSPDKDEWSMLQTSTPDADWPPFREAMNALQERLRKDLLY